MYKHTFYYFLGNKKYPEIYILWHFMTFDIWHFVTFDISWHLTFHGIWHFMTFDIWHLIFDMTEGTDCTRTDAYDSGTILSNFYWWILRLSEIPKKLLIDSLSEQYRLKEMLAHLKIWHMLGLCLWLQVDSGCHKPIGILHLLHGTCVFVFVSVSVFVITVWKKTLSSFLSGLALSWDSS